MTGLLSLYPYAVLLPLVLSGIYSCPLAGWEKTHAKAECYKKFGLGSFKYNFFEAKSICASFCTADVLSAGYKCPHLPERSKVEGQLRGSGMEGTIWLSETEAAKPERNPGRMSGPGPHCTAFNMTMELMVSEGCQRRKATQVVCFADSLEGALGMGEPPQKNVERQKRIVETVNNAHGRTWKAEYNPSAAHETARRNYDEDIGLLKLIFYATEPDPRKDNPHELSHLTDIISGAAAVMNSANELYNPPENDKIPDRFDAREKWPFCSGLHNPTTNQGRCGSCWAVSATAVISDRTCIHTNGSFNRQLSAESVANCVKHHCNGCGGGSGISVFEHWIRNGIVTGGSYGSEEGCQPYSHDLACGYPCPMKSFDRNVACTPKCRPGYTKKYEEDMHYGKVYYKLVEPKKPESRKYAVRNMQWEIMQRGPIWAAFQVTEDFMHYKSGVYQRIDGNFIYGHAVRMIGWGTEDGVPYWLCANSWGRDWGDNGFFKILRGADHLFIELNVVSGMPKVD